MRLSWLVMSLLVVATMALLSERCSAVFNMLPPSNDEWGLKYDLEVTAVEGGKLIVRFTLADAGRLKPIYSATVVAFSRPDASGGQSYLVKSRIKLQPTKDGQAFGEVQIPREFFNIAMVRILTLTVDRRHQKEGAAYYDIPIRKFLERKTSSAPVVAAPPTSKVTK
jgi:hypothetical protein